MPATPNDAMNDGAAAVDEGKSKLLFDISGIDKTKMLADREQIAKWNPHRGPMSLLDGIIWATEDYSMGLGIKYVRDNEFWVPGHFPNRPMFPGVLMIETAAQLACYLFIIRKAAPTLSVFLRIEDAAFRAEVVPGDDLYILCREVKRQRRRFVSKIQGVVGDKIAFDAQISGMSVEKEI